MSRSLIHVGLDVHAQSIAVAIAEAGAEVSLHRSLSSDLHSMDKFLARCLKGQAFLCFESPESKYYPQTKPTAAKPGAHAIIPDAPPEPSNQR